MRPVPPLLPVAAARGLLFDGYFGVTDRDHAEQQRAAQSADRGAKRHEGKEHQRAAIAFKTGGFEQFDPGEPGADAESRAAQGTQNQTEQDKQRDFHGCDFFGSMSAEPHVWSRPARPGSTQG